MKDAFRRNIFRSIKKDSVVVVCVFNLPLDKLVQKYVNERLSFPPECRSLVTAMEKLARRVMTRGGFGRFKTISKVGYCVCTFKANVGQRIIFWAL